MTLLNCLLYAWYGLPLVSKDNMLVLTLNAAGAVTETIYVLVFLIFATKKEKGKIMGLLSFVLAVFAAVALISVFSFYGNSRKNFCGFTSSIFAIIMFASPLAIMRIVIKTKSVEYMPFLLSLFVFFCSTTWFIFGLLENDPFIAVPNGFGCGLGAVQLILYAIYRNRKGETRNPSANGLGEMGL